MVDSSSKTEREPGAGIAAVLRARELEAANPRILGGATVVVLEQGPHGIGQNFYVEGREGDADRLGKMITKLAQREANTFRVGIPGEHADWQSALRGDEALDRLRSIRSRLVVAERETSAYAKACASSAASPADERAAAFELEVQRLTVRDAVHRGPPSSRTPRLGFHMGDGDWEIAQHQMHWLIDSHGRHEWAQLARHVGAGYAFERATDESVVGDHGQKFLLVKDGQPIGPEAWVAVDWPRDAAPSLAAGREILSLIRQAFDLHQANEDLLPTLARIRELSSASFRAGLTAP